jgi:DamX protein
LFSHGKFSVKAQIKSPDSGYPLITRERTEKLELLNHLVSNLAHAIVVCGPEGIGKTKVLKTFQDTTEEPWIFCWLTGDNQLKLDKIQESLNESIVQAMPDLKSLSLANAFSRIASRNKKIVMVIDDAGNLPPGLIEKIIAYAERKPVLRVVFALTHSEIYLKNGTDPAIDDCYQIDVPPLSEQECGDFLEYLSTFQNPRIEFNAINESRVAALYSETHGIPGNILAKLPTPDNSKKADYSKPVLFGSVFGLIVLALGLQWWSNRPVATEKKQEHAANTGPVTTNPKASAQAVQPETTHPAESSPSVSGKPTVISNDVVASPLPMSNDQGIAQNAAELQQPVTTEIAQNPAQSSVNDDAKLALDKQIAEQAQTVVPIPADEGGRWLVTQPAQHYTLQLMALPNEQTITEVLQRHQQALGQNLKYLKTKTRSGRDRFVLIYGSFASPEQAKTESAVLPKELQKFWMRQMSAIQNEIGTAIPTDTPE